MFAEAVQDNSLDVAIEKLDQKQLGHANMGKYTMEEYNMDVQTWITKELLEDQIIFHINSLPTKDALVFDTSANLVSVMS